MEAKRVMSGTWGEVWINGEKVAGIKAFQTKLEFDKEEVMIAGKMSTGHKVMGWNGTGSLTLNKVDSKMIKLLLPIIKGQGVPDITIVAKLADPDALGQERFAFSGVMFDDLTIMDWATKELTDTEHPFTFEDVEPIDMV